MQSSHIPEKGKCGTTDMKRSHREQTTPFEDNSELQKTDKRTTLIPIEEKLSSKKKKKNAYVYIYFKLSHRMRRQNLAKRVEAAA